ncbi:MAG: hypothetical protein L0K86_15345 [Actinomycetia bacterium]|nr:hypothetical protein [Actinomycetes bacterium]
MTVPGAYAYVLCFGDGEPDQGPHPVSRADLQSVFDLDDNWRVVSIHAERLRSQFNAEGSPAWLATVVRH